jgi:hypothetical protein
MVPNRLRWGLGRPARELADVLKSPGKSRKWPQQLHPTPTDTLVGRLRTLWLAKMLATTLGITAFLVAYFWTLHHPLFEITVMPLTSLDEWIGFQPLALPLYLSLWCYVSLGPALLKNRDELRAYCMAALTLSLVGLGIFIAWPTATPSFGIDWSQHPSIFFLKDIDMAANACPSLHVAFAVFTAFWLMRLLSEMRAPKLIHVLNWLWCLGILYSTIATRQHVVLDVLAGTLLGAAAAALHLRKGKRFIPFPRSSPFRP